MTGSPGGQGSCARPGWTRHGRDPRPGLLDLLLGKDSRPGQDQDSTPSSAAAGFAGRVTLTVPLATLAGLADRPGDLGGLGPVDPWLARDLARAAARNPKTTWCLTVTDEKGHAVAHGCAHPQPKSHRKRAGPGPSGETGSPSPSQPRRPAQWLWHLAAAHPRHPT